jgi:hypothetical protein
MSDVPDTSSAVDGGRKAFECLFGLGVSKRDILLDVVSAQTSPNPSLLKYLPKLTFDGVLMNPEAAALANRTVLPASSPGLGKIDALPASSPGLGKIDVLPASSPGLGKIDVLPASSPGLGKIDVLPTSSPGLDKLDVLPSGGHGIDLLPANALHSTDPTSLGFWMKFFKLLLDMLSNILPSIEHLLGQLDARLLSHYASESWEELLKRLSF